MNKMGKVSRKIQSKLTTELKTVFKIKIERSDRPVCWNGMEIDTLSGRIISIVSDYRHSVVKPEFVSVALNTVVRGGIAALA